MELRAYRDEDLEPLLALWVATKRATYDFIPAEQSRPLEDDRRFLRERILPCCEVWLAEEARGLAGFLALRGSYVDRLYVHPARQREGVGHALLAHARRRSPHALELHTHVANRGARAFYEREGFVAVRFGTSPPPESLPDVEYHWRP